MYERLATLKTKYDPDKLLRREAYVVPHASATVRRLFSHPSGLAQSTRAGNDEHVAVGQSASYNRRELPNSSYSIRIEDRLVADERQIFSLRLSN